MINKMKTTDCDQTKCVYLNMEMGCRACDTCGADPFLINEHCDRCWNCKSDEGLVRWEDHKEGPEDHKELTKDNQKPLEVENIK